MKTSRILVLAFLACGCLSWAQNCAPPPEAPIVAHPAGTMLPDIGSSDMPITAKNDKTKRLVRQGFALIHCFWPLEAIRTFREATKEDPTCAIAWCGLNISLTQPWFAREEYKAEAEYAIKKAIANVETAGEAEQELIRAFRLRSVGKGDRDPEFEKAMQALIDKHFSLDEPRLLWAGIRCQLCMNKEYTSEGDPYGDLDFVVKIIEPVIKRSPNSPGAMHYWIHACEPASPKRAEKAADNLLKVAKGSPHLVHMPGHIYNRIGRYEDGQKAFGTAKQMDEALGAKFNVAPVDADWQYYHNVSFQAMNLLELGRIREATELSKIAGTVRTHIAARTGDFLKAHSGRTDTKGKAFASAYEARQALITGNVADARAKVDLAKKAVDRPERNGERTDYRLLKTVALEADGLVLAAEGKFDEAVQALRQSIEFFNRVSYNEPVDLIQTPYESLGEVLIKAKRYDDAVKAYQDGLKVRPNSGWLLYGIARAHEEGGRKKEAEQAYAVFLKAWATADKDRPELRRAEEFMAAARPRASTVRRTRCLGDGG